MKQFIRVIALCLSVFLLLGATVSAAAAPAVLRGKDPGQMSTQELIAHFRIPNNWARPDLIFAARSGIMDNKDDRGICPKDTVTRGEFAQMLDRLFRTETEADLSGYKDVDAQADYYDALARVKAMGVLAGNGKTKLRPDDALTREEAFVTAARIFGIAGSSKQGVYEYKDWDEVHDWAVLELSAMIRRGYVKGGSTKLYPGRAITRQELAHVLHTFLDRVTTDLGSDSVSGSTALIANKIPAGTTVEGDLLVVNEASRMKLENVTVTGRLILQGNSKVVLTLKNCSIGELVTCRSTVIHAEEGRQIRKLGVHALTRLYGDVPTVNTYANFVLRSGFTVNQLSVYPKADYLTVEGTAKEVTVYQEDLRVDGSGSIGTLTAKARGLDLRCQTETRKTSIPTIVSAARFSRTDGKKADSGSPKLKMGLKITKLSVGKHDCTVTWSVNSTQVQSKRMLLESGDTVYCTYDFAKLIAKDKTSATVTVVLTSEGRTATYTGKVSLENLARTEAKTIRTQAIQAKTTVTTAMYAYYNVYSCTFSTFVKNVPAGTQVTILKTSKSIGAHVRLPDGSDGWISYSAMNIISGNYYTTKDYSKEAKEYYVNKLKPQSSTTDYLIWVSLYTQHVNIFKGSKGNWKLIHSYSCSSGKNSTPTPVGNLTVTKKDGTWWFSNYYCHHVTNIDESRAFHSRPTNYDNTIHDYAMGKPASNGCIRMTDEGCTWIYNNIPVGTTVHLF